MNEAGMRTARLLPHLDIWMLIISPHNYRYTYLYIYSTWIHMILLVFGKSTMAHGDLAYGRYNESQVPERWQSGRMYLTRNQA